VKRGGLVSRVMRLFTSRRRGKIPMPIDRNALLALWRLEDIPACDVGMELAITFLESCGEGVDRLGCEEPADRITEITSSYTALVEHAADCEKCNKV
jgi:hypothetical protein